MPITPIPKQLLLKPENPVLNRTHPLARSLRYAYLFNEGAGESTYALGRPNKATIIGALWGRGKYGRQLTFSASGTTYVNTNVPWDFAQSDSFSVVILANVSSAATTGQLNFYGRSLSSGNFPELIFGLGIVTNGVPGAYISGVSTGNNTISGGTDMRDDKWHQFAYVFDGNAQKLNIYADTRLAVRGSITTTGGVKTNPNNVNIGVEDSTTSFPMQMASLLHYDRALTPGDLRNLFIDPWGPFRPSIAQRAYMMVDKGAVAGVAAVYNAVRMMMGMGL